MNMDGMDMGIPWLDSPVQLHSSRADTCKLSKAQCAWRRGHWRYWYQADHVYGHATVYFMCATIAVFTVAHLLSRFSPSSVSRNGPLSKVRASLRYLAYKGFRINSLRWSSPALGVMLLGLAGAVYFFALTLGPKPYYWPNTKDGKVSFGGSPPIATRSGWMALALLPFVMALSAKANMISALTGISYERLQVYHHWTSYAMFVLALVHTFPFIVYNIWKGDMVEEWNTTLTYWTGVAALIPQAWLTIMSIGPIRNRYYELFKATHLLAALLFVLFFFFHCDFRLTSWDYFIATGVIYLSSLTYSALKTYFEHGMRTASIESLPSGLIRIAVDAGNATWKPGQHVFLRFWTPNFHALTAHPFTICSLPANQGAGNQMVFYAKARGGFTGRLAKLGQQKNGGTVKVFVEGPYGGLGVPGTLERFDDAVVIAGGSGAGFTFAIIEDILRRSISTSEKDATQAKNLFLVLATPSNAVADWYRTQLDHLLSTYSRTSHRISVAIHISGLASGSDLNLSQQPEVKSADEKAKRTSTVIVDPPSPTRADGHNIETFTGRPDLPKFIRERTSRQPGREVGIAVCGPSGMLQDVREAAAEAQGRVVSGEVGGVWLHAEHFGW